MKIEKADTGEKVLIVAEIGNNHEGKFSVAEEMIGIACEAGVDAVKFQTFRTEHYIGSDNRERYNMLKSFELTEEDYQKLKKKADESKLLFISTPFDVGSATFLNGFIPAFKISSGDNTFFPLLEVVARFGKPILMSCGLSDLQQIRYSKAFIENIWYQQGIEQELALLHCVTSYPVARREANLKAIQYMKREFDCEIGYSDHTLGIEAVILSVAAGARIVEKHFTIDKHFSGFRDHSLSADPKELKEMVVRVREAEEFLGTGTKRLNGSEKENEILVRRSIAASKDLKKGHIICYEDLTWVRPGDGLPPGEESRVLGKQLRKNVNKGEQIWPEYTEIMV